MRGNWPGLGRMRYGTRHIAFGNNSTFGWTNFVRFHTDCVIANPSIIIDSRVVVNNKKIVECALYLSCIITNRFSPLKLQTSKKSLPLCDNAFKMLFSLHLWGFEVARVEYRWPPHIPVELGVRQSHDQANPCA